MAPILGIWASSKSTVAADTGAMFPLQVITVGPAGASSISFTNIPTTGYAHLQIRATLRGTGDIGYQILRFNSDTGSNYAGHGINTNGSTVSTFADVNNDTAGQQNASGTADIFTAYVIDILDYQNTNKFKTVRTLSGFDTNGAGTLSFRSALWRSTSAITSMSFAPNTNNYAQYSQFALYGIKGA
jgi:hypothetical protein